MTIEDSDLIFEKVYLDFIFFPDMEFEKLADGDKIKINDKIYDVLKVGKESDIVKPPKYKARIFVVVYLYDWESKLMTPSHELHYYPDTKKAYLLGVRDRKREVIDLDKVKMNK